MKKRLLSSVVLAISACTMLFAQTVQENELAVVYYMPQTQLEMTIQYDKIIVKPGPFYLYAERYLGVKEVATESSTRYEVTNISLKPHTVADISRAYKVVNETQWLSLTPDGLLYGYNVPAYIEKTLPTETAKVCNNTPPTLMPLLEEQMIASSIAKMAEGAAKQIYHIREMRINLLAGDVEHTPADGQSMQLVLNELDKREQMLAELFIGSRTVEQLSYTFYYTPTKDVTNEVICRFSQYSGVVTVDDLSGEPIRLTLTGIHQSYLPMVEETTKPNKVAISSQIYYNLPGYANIEVKFSDKLHTTTSLPIAQFGVAVPIAKGLLLNKQTPKIYFNTQTGNILSIEQ